MRYLTPLALAIAFVALPGCYVDFMESGSDCYDCGWYGGSFTSSGELSLRAPVLEGHLEGWISTESTPMRVYGEVDDYGNFAWTDVTVEGNPSGGAMMTRLNFEARLDDPAFVPGSVHHFVNGRSDTCDFYADVLGCSGETDIYEDFDAYADSFEIRVYAVPGRPDARDFEINADYGDGNVTTTRFVALN